MTAEAGRELDEAIAKEVMGQWSEEVGWYGPFSYLRGLEPNPGEIVGGYSVPHGYSTTYAGAGEVLERLRELGWLTVIHYPDTTLDSNCLVRFYKATVPGGELQAFRAVGATFPHAMCLAALEAVRA